MQKKKKKLPHSVVFWVAVFVVVVLHGSLKLNDGCEQSPDFLTIDAC